MQNSIRYYKLYTNKSNTYLPTSFEGVIKVLDETEDNLINIWAQKELGNMYDTYDKKLIKKWGYELISNIDGLEDKMLKCIKRTT